MAFLRYALPVFIVLILGLQGYKWYRIYQLRASNKPTPPGLWKLILLPWAAVFLCFGVLLAWALVESLTNR